MELKQLFDTSDGVISEQTLKDTSCKVLLPLEECRMWLNHLQTVSENRRRGARKAAETRRGKKSQKSNFQATSISQSDLTPTQEADGVTEEWFCGVCEGKYIDQTEEPEFWICCEQCDKWYHADCEGLSSLPPEEDSYCCLKCQAS